MGWSRWREVNGAEEVDWAERDERGGRGRLGGLGRTWRRTGRSRWIGCIDWDVDM